MNLVEWQKVDEQSGLIMPWFTHAALEEIAKMDWSDKIVFSWGGGMGDAWVAKKCKMLYVIERDENWLIKAAEYCAQNGVTNIEYFHRPCNEGIGDSEMYCEIPNGVHPNVIIVDDIFRYECILTAIQHKPCTLIVDNYMQAFVFICPSAEEVLKPYNGKLYEQSDHTNNDGVNKWKTAIFDIK